MKSSDIFELVRPQCVYLTKSVETVKASDITALRKILGSINIEKTTFQELQEYLLFPLRLILRTNKRSDVIIQALDLMKYVFDNTIITTRSMFDDVFMQLLILISSPKENIVVLDVCEEMKVSTLTCLQSLISHISLQIMEHIYKYEFYLPLSHAIYISLQMIENDSSRDIKVNALEIILKLSEPKDIGQLQSLAGNKLASFLPGITSCLTRVVTSDFHQGHVVIVNIIKVLQKIITLTLSDRNLQNSSEVKEKLVKNQNIPNIKRNEDWIKTTAENLSVLIKQIVSLVCHSHWKVRLALAEFSESLLLQCTSSLHNCISSLLEILLILSVDDYSNVSDKSNAILKEFAKYNVNNNRNILDILEDDLHSLVIKLPRIVKTQDEKQILSSLNLLLGYLNVFGSQIVHFLHSLPHQKRIILALLHMAELENSSLIDEVATQTSILGMDHLHWPKKNFKYFRSDQINEKFCCICHIMGTNGDIPLLIDCLLDKIETPVYCRQSVLILNELLLGIKYKKEKMNEMNESAHLIEYFKMIMETYLSSDLFNVKVSNFTNSGEENLSLEKIKANIQQVCLLLEGISNLAKVSTLFLIYTDTDNLKH
ncbi:TELO2-interacting protein 1 homolog [Centruroides sculpturatus]|uniref:TELO2-interacting protein 1 homolog n=1 Tax=Centruroides sculpturatus TaxID=218467 RepID=UPI000C6DE31D|nr:TELO2-interacting protein 1 homolog [Centruroides sculpturatus]